MASSRPGSSSNVENPPPGEPARIENIAKLTVKQLENRYTGKPRFLRGVHPKDHGCVEATFTVADDLADELRVGLFEHCGQSFRAVIRFSNASALVGDDMTVEEGVPIPTHGSRGMAIKLYDVGGDRLVPGDGERTLDFLMINQPVFAFANVEDYEVLSELIAKDDATAGDFFKRQGLTGPALARMLASLDIVLRIKGLKPPPFQAPPLSPLDNRYFSAAPFAFGDGRVMKFSAKPVNPASGDLGDAVKDADYLRNAMKKRMAAADGKDICFDFQVQVRAADNTLDVDNEMENMCTLWNEEDFPFDTVARITIPTPQDISSKERQEFCETLFYTPWHGLEAHRPLGGINRLRQSVYDTSFGRRCPASGSPPGPSAGAGAEAMGKAAGSALLSGSIRARHPR